MSYLFGICSLPFMCLISSSSSFLIHLQEKMWKVHEACTVKILVSNWIWHPNDRVYVTTNVSFSLVLLEHIFISSFIRIHHYYWLNHSMWLARSPTPRMDQSLIPSSREPWITGGLVCKFTCHVTKLILLQSNMYL